MARQHGTNPITGKLGDLSFYYNQAYGHLVRSKGGPSKRQILTGVQFDITRRNMSEFGRASHYGKLIRYGFAPLIKQCKESQMYSRLSTRLRQLMKADTVSEFGKRDLRTDNMQLFTHFELDQYSLSSQYFELPVETKLNNGSLEVTAGISLTRKPPGIDGWKLMSVAVGIDFIKQEVHRSDAASDVYVFEKGGYADGFIHTVPEGGILFHGMCIAWYRYDATTDDYTPLKEKHKNAGFIGYVGVDG